ncbi:MAG: 5-formyltetrahydrofolate cyclo-ligase [Bacteroidales bacterium]|nr:5-formyltetrahydrofolate cyclo-ligase [Bacteroidales bacterium]
MSEEKKQIRKRMRELQEQFLSDPVRVREETGRIWSALENKAAFKNAGAVLLYMSIPGEVETADFIDKWHLKKRIVIPLVSGESLILKEYSPAHLKEGYKGILEPTDEAVTVPAEELDLAIVPGVAFTAKGERLGRGGGFYDRLIPQLRCPVIGVCYPFRIVDGLPTEPWDALLTGVIF